MRNIYKIGVLALGLATMGACTDGFDEINENPNDPLVVSSNLYLPSVLERTGDVMYSTGIGGDMGSTWAQHWSKVQYNEEERYSPRGSAIASFWDNMYAGNLMDTQIMAERAVAEENDNMLGIALVMRAYTFSMLTDVFGAIPFTDALQAREGTNNPAYTPQADVYAGIVNLLDSASNLISANGGPINATSDIMYEGDYSKWEQFANSLKFRVLMRQSGKVDVSSQLQALMNQPMFSSNAEEAKLVYLSTSPNANPHWTTIVQGNRGEFKVGAPMIETLDALDDPRLPVYAEVNDAGIYRGKPAGIQGVPNDDYNFNNVSSIGSFYLQPESPAYFLSFAELQFLKAEAAKRGLISGGDAAAADFYRSGIAASMEANGIDDYQDYLEEHALVSSTALAQIGVQKWIALYGQGIEAWTEWRRTGFPALSPAIDGAVDQIPLRWTYPSGEQSLNEVNYDAAVSAQGADRLTTPVWWIN